MATRHPLIAELLNRTPVILDGAWGTQLQARGLPRGESPDGWNLTHPETVEEIPRAYVEAGSRVVLTNTFRGNRIALSSAGLGEQTAAVNRAGAEISKRAAGDRALVFGSMGPTGKMVCMEEIGTDELREVFAEQAAALAAGGADGIVVETMGDLEEARVAVEAAQQTQLPIVACMCFDSGSEHDRTMMGITPEQAAETLSAAGADVIGANCGQGIAGYVSIGRRLARACDRPIWIKANAGLPKLVGDEVVYETTADEFAGHAGALIDAGVAFLGGCCGTTPEFIAALCRKLTS